MPGREHLFLFFLIFEAELSKAEAGAATVASGGGVGLRVSVLACFAENGGHVEAPWLYFWDISAQIEN